MAKSKLRNGAKVHRKRVENRNSNIKSEMKKQQKYKKKHLAHLTLTSAVSLVKCWRPAFDVANETAAR